MIGLDRLLAFAEDYRSALSGMAGLSGGHPVPARSFRFHRDWGAATENGLRSALAILLAGAFGIATGWKRLVAPAADPRTLRGPARHDRNPAASAGAFVNGTIVAVPAAFVCAFGLIPNVQGFPLLIAVLAPFWMAGLYATTLPRHMLSGLAFLVAFNTLVGATNPMVFSVRPS